MSDFHSFMLTLYHVKFTYHKRFGHVFSPWFLQFTDFVKNPSSLNILCAHGSQILKHFLMTYFRTLLKSLLNGLQLVVYEWVTESMGAHFETCIW